MTTPPRPSDARPVARTLTCHCGAVELSVVLKTGLDRPGRCDCSFCRRRGAANVSVARGDLTIIRGAEKLSLYQFNTNEAEHYFCAVCGIYTHHRRRSDPDEYGVNLGALDGVNPAHFEPIPWADGVNHPSDQSQKGTMSAPVRGSCVKTETNRKPDQ